jgi:N4-gp56 family major capsid protein
MAATNFLTNNSLAVKAWAKKLYVQAIYDSYASRFMGSSSTSLIQVRDEVRKGPGDKVTVGLRMQLNGTGIAGDDTLEGNEEALVTYSDSVLVDQLRHAVRSKGKMSEQRVAFDVMAEHQSALSDWFADRIDEAFFNQIAGNTAKTDARYTGSNSTVAPSTNNIIRVGTSATTTDGSLSTVDTFTTTTLDRAVAKAKTLNDSGQPIIRPIRHKGQDKYVAFLHPYQVYSLRTTATANTVTWWEINRAALSGGREEAADNIYRGSLGEYNGIILHESARVPLCSDTTSAIANTRRAIFCGAQAAIMATGRESDSPDSKMSLKTEEFDYGNQVGISAGLIWGMKKSVFNSNDFGVITMHSYAAAP